MVSLKNFYTPRDARERVFADIRSVLSAVLDFCIANKDLLTQEERSSIINEYRSLVVAHVQANDDKDRCFNSTLPGLLKKCEKLQSRVQWACTKHKEDEFMRAPAAIVTPGSSKSSIALIDPDPSLRAPSEISISAQSNPNLATTGGNGSNPSTPSLLTGTSNSVVSASIPVVQETTSSTSAAPTERSPLASPSDTNCMIFDQQSSVGSPTFNIDSEGAIGATVISRGDDPSPRISPQGLQPFTSARQPQTAPTMSRDSVMYFGPGMTVDSPTFNIRSKKATGIMEVQRTAYFSEPLTEPFR
ncbi:uncharacterized protein F5891DRAFT_1025975 [Suillus fuscotomentosus]|uniref:Uncharacterized protein n=1 Tax=Suillus fuscotomentosus TaxID=1912939 RepID=A0AAD4HMH9_9AGAM|nr:uncharacterized protein F5891DRAFT_1025975 [Suillus fuscotomentosus]KAG1901887.1 hypothetical protein F5891DRAFT_1025975 [Suillus fuscotomentosus]